MFISYIFFLIKLKYITLKSYKKRSFTEVEYWKVRINIRKLKSFNFRKKL